MRLFYLAAVAFVTFVAGGDAKASRVSVPDISSQHRAHIASTNVESTTRLLRTSIINEERAGGGISVPVVDKLAKILKSSKVTEEQLQKWLSKGKTAESVFYRMGLSNAGITTLFESPQFIRWLQYADDLRAFGKGTPVMTVLSTQYSDDSLYRMIELVKKESKTKALGTRLQADQLEHWGTVRKDPDDIFKLYNLNRAGKNILSEPQFAAWVKYVDDLNTKKKGTAVVSIIPTLRKHYSDKDLFKIVLAAKGIDKTEAMGIKLEDAFVQFWIHRKDTPENVMLKLGLGETTRSLLENPLLSTLTKYTDAYSVQYKKTTVIETLRRAFDDETVAKILHAGKAEATTKRIATRFETELLEMWRDSGKSVDDVYKLLNLPHSRDLLTGFNGEPLFNTWLAYMNALSFKNPEKTSALFLTLATSFNDRPMMQILQAAKKYPSMEKSAAKLQLEKAQRIFSSGLSPSEAFTSVALDNVGDSVLSSPLFKKWMDYVDNFNKNNPWDKKSWFLIIRSNYHDRDVGKIIDKAMKDPSAVELAKLAEKERMKEWLEKWRNPPDQAFRDLKLKKEGEKVFLSPKFELWVKYLSDWNQAYSHMNKKMTMLDGIRGNYDDLDLVPILAAAEKVPSTQKLASQLQDALVDKWIAEKKTVADLKGWLTPGVSSDDILKRFTTKLNSA